ncbi:MAG: hypothetical protein MJ166_05990 [Clostridia bacterium]|nr:hypothetical protein [Clostridia bacterium]
MKSDTKDKLKNVAKVGIPKLLGVTTVKKVCEIAGQGVDYVENKYNEHKLESSRPVSIEELNSDGFEFPTMIKIVDRSTRSKDDLYNTAAGWIENKSNQVLFLYQKFVDECEKEFIPAPDNETVFYYDPNCPSKYISVETYFEEILDSKLAELERIAFAIGAKHYRVELRKSSSYSESRKDSQHHKAGVAVFSGETGLDTEKDQSKKTSFDVLAEATLEKNNTPFRPELKWFKNSDRILNLIDMACSGKELTEYKVGLKCSKILTMSATAAANIEATYCKIGGSSSLGYSKKVKEEMHQEFLYILEF